MRSRIICPLLVLALLCLDTGARAQQSSALINEALDRLVKLELNETLPQAMRTIAKETGVRIEATPAVWDLLPWGEQTKIQAKIENKTLREALEAITRSLGLQFVLRDEAIELQPMPALRRLGRRSTVKELEALNLLAGTPADLGTDRPTVRQLVEAVDQKLVDLKSPFNIENRPGDRVAQDAQVFVPRNATLLDALESLAKDTRATWYPWGTNIVIVPKEDQVRNQLGKTITIRYNGVDVAQVLTELSQRSGVDFMIEPGAIQRIPPEFRTVRLLLDNATIQQALEYIAGFTGLGYVVNEHGVYVWNQSSTPGTSGARDPVIGMIQLDNGMQVLIPRSEMPADLQEYIKHKKQREFEKMRQQMQEEGFKAATQPTTRNEDL